MAGNFPFAGLHDLICVIISGNIALVKPSKSDKILIDYLIDYLWNKFPKSKHYIKTEILKRFDKVIATGSNNTFRYFEYYFEKNKYSQKKQDIHCNFGKVVLTKIHYVY